MKRHIPRGKQNRITLPRNNASLDIVPGWSIIVHNLIWQHNAPLIVISNVLSLILLERHCSFDEYRFSDKSPSWTSFRIYDGYFSSRFLNLHEGKSCFRNLIIECWKYWIFITILFFFYNYCTIGMTLFHCSILFFFFLMKRKRYPLKIYIFLNENKILQWK